MSSVLQNSLIVGGLLVLAAIIIYSVVRLFAGRGLVLTFTGLIVTMVVLDCVISFILGQIGVTLLNLIITFGPGFVVTFGGIFYLFRVVVAPTRRLTETMKRLAVGDLQDDYRYTRQDEIGQLSAGITDMIAYQRDMARLARLIAKGDLRETVVVKSPQDEFGHAFKEMLDQLNKALGLVSDNSTNLDETSKQLSLVSNQVSTATNQISNAIQQVAKGTAQQTESASKTVGSIDHLSRTIDGVANGAQEQALAITETSQVMSQLSEVIKDIQQGAQRQVEAVFENRTALENLSNSVSELFQGTLAQSQELGQASTAGEDLSQAIAHVSEAAKQVSNQVEEAERAARNGSTVVIQTTSGMERVRSATETLADRVKELGQRSGQIGMIIETIDDIASQTNLLALNAAIEAARAGEHGRGFAVVADEVRKLAEKSTLATAEIADLIKKVQSGAVDAVDAMQQAGIDVSAASEYTEQAKTAFEEILLGTTASAEGVKIIGGVIEEMDGARQALESAVWGALRVAEDNKGRTEQMEALNKVVVERLNGVQEVAQANTNAAQQIANLNDMVIEKLNSTSMIVKENTTAAKEMTVSANDFTTMVENIASVSEENSAATEEVSASAEEVTAQVEEVTSSAQSLAEMAHQLQEVVSQFKISWNAQTA